MTSSSNSFLSRLFGWWPFRKGKRPFGERKLAMILLRALTVLCALLAFAMLVDTFIISTKDHEQLAASLVGVFGALALAFLALASPGALEEFSFGPFKAKWRIKELEIRVESLQLAILTLLSCHERSHLRKLEARAQNKNVEYRDSLYRELERLWFLGYVEPAEGSGGLPAIAEEKGEFELAHYLKITRMGQKYLDLYREWTPPIEVGRDGGMVIDGKPCGRAEEWKDIADGAAKAGWMSEPDDEDVDWARGASLDLRKPRLAGRD